MKEMGHHIVNKQCEQMGLNPADIRAEDLPALSSALTTVMQSFHSEEKARALSKEILKLRDIEDILDKMPDKQKKVLLLFDVATASLHCGDFEKADGYLDSALEMIAANESLVMAKSSALQIKGVVQREMGHMDEAWAYFAEAAKDAESQQDPIQQARCLYELANLAWKMAKYDDAKRFLDQAEGLGESDLLLDGLINLAKANVAADTGQFEAAERFYKMAIESITDTDNTYELARAYNNLGDLQLEHDKFQDAKPNFRKCIKISREGGDLRMEGWAKFNLSEIALKEHDLVQAPILLDEAEAILKKIRDFHGMAGVHRMRALIYVQKGDKEMANSLFERTLQETREHGLGYLEAVVLNDYGKTLKTWGELSKGNEMQEKAVAKYKEMGLDDMAQKVFDQ